MRELAIDRGGLLAVVVLVAYAWLAPAHVVDGDNAEFSTLATTGGIAHPSGYPLFLLWLRAWSWLPVASPAHAAALATAVIGAATVLVLHAACRAWGARPLGATLACALFAAAPVVVRVATEAEVFALNNLVVASVLWLAAGGGPARGIRRAALLGLVAGLGIANHLTCVLVAPIGIYGVVLAAREVGPRALAAAAAGLVVGLLPYAYAFVAPDAPMSWGAVRDLDGLVGHILRRDYGSGELIAHGARVPATETIGALLATLGRAWLWLPLALGAAAWGLRVRDRATRWPWALLALSWLVVGPGFVSRFNSPPSGIGLYIMQRFHVLPALLLAIPIAVGFDLVTARAPRWAAPLAATLGFAAALVASLPRVARLHTAAVEHYARNMLHALPPNAVVFEWADAFYFSAGYVQWALGERQDVVVVAWPTMATEWYRERAAGRGILAEPGDEPAIVRVVTHLLSVGTPVFLEPLSPDAQKLARVFPTYPYGPLVRVLPRGTPSPPLDEVVARNKDVYGAFDLAYPRPGGDDEWATIVHERYAATWQVLGGALQAARRTDDAAAAFALARELGPAP